GERAQPAQVLPRDLPVGADVGDADRPVPVPQVIDRTGRDALGHQRLAQTHLVGDQEAVDRVFIQPQPPERVVHSGPLERFQTAEDAAEIGALLPHRRLRSWTAWSTTSHIWRNSAGITSAACGICRSSEICRATAASEDGSWPAARTNGSNSTRGGRLAPEAPPSTTSCTTSPVGSSSGVSRSPGTRSIPSSSAR